MAGMDVWRTFHVMLSRALVRLRKLGLESPKFPVEQRQLSLDTSMPQPQDPRNRRYRCCRAGCGSARCAEVQSRRLQSSNVGRQECWQAPPASASDARVGECAPRHREEPGTCAFTLDGWRCRRRAAELQRAELRSACGWRCARSEERRVGHECGSKWRARG